LKKIEEEHIRRVLAITKSLQEAADILGIDQATLWRLRKKYGIWCRQEKGFGALLHLQVFTLQKLEEIMIIDRNVAMAMMHE
jgi:hypothetical protein